MKHFHSYFLYLTVFVTGAAVLIIEILGTRVLAPFYGSTIFVWSSLISVTLGFLALGYWLGGLLADRRPDFKVFYGIIFLAGIFTSLVMKIDQPVLALTDQFGLRFGPIIASVVLFAVSFFLLGMVTPFAIRLRTHLLEKVGTRSGSIFAFSTLGSLVGAILAGFFLIPHFSLAQIFLVMAGLLMILALIGGLLLGQIRIRTKIITFIVFLLVSALFLNLEPQHYVEKVNTMQILHQEPSFYADLKIIEVAWFKCLVMDGSTQTCINTKNNQSGFGYVHEIKYQAENQLSDKEDILLLGLGGGMMMQIFSENQKVDAVEIDPKIALLGEKFFDLQLNSNQKVFIDDARSFVRNTDKKYDWIIVDIAFGSSIPWHIFTKESFQSWKDCLKPNGLISLNFIGYIQEEDLATVSIIKTVRSVFPSVLITAESPEYLSSIIVYLSPEKDYNFPRPGKNYIIVDLEGNQGTLLTDAKSSLDLLMVPNLEELRESYQDFGGYRMFFAN